MYSWEVIFESEIFEFEKLKNPNDIQEWYLY